MTYEDWLQVGRSQGWLIVEFCAAHETPFSPDERNASETGEDPCLAALRVVIK